MTDKSKFGSKFGQKSIVTATCEIWFVDCTGVKDVRLMFSLNEATD